MGKRLTVLIIFLLGFCVSMFVAPMSLISFFSGEITSTDYMEAGVTFLVGIGLMFAAKKWSEK